MSNYAFDDNSNRVPVGLTAYPVGSIYMSMNPTSPAELFGGTWEALNQGRVLIGASSSHPVGETGGSETVTLTSSQIPVHTHSFSATSSLTAIDHRHSLSSAKITGETEEAGGHTHRTSSACGSGMGTDGSPSSKRSPSTTPSWMEEAGVHTHTINATLSGSTGLISTGNSSDGYDGNAYCRHTHTVSGTTGSTGGGGSHSNMQPYLAVYMWYRTA